jgi:TM2 domain-containing membrane protein YozV
MTLKQKAIVQTAGILAIIVGGSLGLTAIMNYLTAGQILNGLACASIALLIYSMYGVVLSRLEYEDSVKKMVDNQSK